MRRIFLFLYMLVTKVVAASIAQNWTVQRQDQYHLYVIRTCHEVLKYSYLTKLEVVGVYLRHYYCLVSE